MANILNSKKKLTIALGEVTRRLAMAVGLLEQIRNAPPPHTWSEEDKKKLRELIDSTIAEAKREL